MTAVSLEMVIPGMIGYWIDRQLGTILLFLVLGLALGVTLGIVHLVRMTAPPNLDARDEETPADDDAKADHDSNR